MRSEKEIWEHLEKLKGIDFKSIKSDFTKGYHSGTVSILEWVLQ